MSVRRTTCRLRSPDIAIVGHGLRSAIPLTFFLAIVCLWVIAIGVNRSTLKQSTIAENGPQVKNNNQAVMYLQMV
jgi:hypothetical protein